MPQGKVHAAIALACGFATWVLLWAWKGTSGWLLLFVAAWAWLFATGPDRDQDHRIGYGHRNGLVFHAPWFPLLVSLAVLGMAGTLPPCPAWENPVLEVAALFDIAWASHLLADLSSKAENAGMKWPKRWGRAWLALGGLASLGLALGLLSLVV